MSRPIAAIACLSWFACLVGILAPPATATAGWSWPVHGEVITHYRNGADPYAAGQHRGVDIAAEAGTPVVAAAGGTVRFAGVAGSSGLTVSVRTADGRFDVSYLHLSAAGVREDDAISAGDRLGTVGTSGRRSAARAHLHFGVREGGTRHAYVDPLTLLGPPPASSPREGPRVVPAPAPVPVLPVRVRAPDPVRRPVARRLRLPAGRRVPAARRVPAPRLGPSPSLVRGPSTAPALRPLPVLRRGGARGRARPARAPDRHPGLGPAAAGAPVRAPAPTPTPASAADPRSAGRGPDLGWALACLGLLLAAALMGRARDGGRAAAGAARRADRPDPRAALRAGVLKLRSKGG